ncbi:anti-sigma factor family protein [Marinobacter halotolerans]|uniref:anti-sigma factor family protein n=1 Tax=Marinobacter halotolerans TaxID=1569211 RepID=UPI001CD94897|nr:zf-HC2 domain-containing protein [Marinobacter halotolerans]
MSCSSTREHIQPWLRGELSEAESAAVEKHVAGCYRCARVVESESAILNALQAGYQVPEPSTGFESRVLAAATEADASAGRHRSVSTAWVGGAVAAALVLGVAIGVGLQPGATTGEARVATDSAPAPSNTQTVRLAFNAAEAMTDVTLTLELPAHVEMASYPGHQQLSWNVSLDKGENIVELPLNIMFPGEGVLVAHLDNGERRKTFRADLPRANAASRSEPVL